MHEVLVNRLGGLSLPRKSVVRLTDRPDMTLDVYCGRKTTIQQLQYTFANKNAIIKGISLFISIPTAGWQETCSLLPAGWQETLVLVTAGWQETSPKIFMNVICCSCDWHFKS